MSNLVSDENKNFIADTLNKDTNLEAEKTLLSQVGKEISLLC